GTTIARRTARKLGWDLYTQEHLEFLSANEVARSQVQDGVPAGGVAWAEEQLDHLRSAGVIGPNSELNELARLLLLLAARGHVVLVGRGAGFFLPRETTLHARIVAPPEDRVAHMAQSLRLTREEAAEQVRQRDEKRLDFLVRHFQRRLIELYDFDLVLNSCLLGEELSADLIVAAVHGKQRLRERAQEQ
ncbi:MAG TPA: cytidylate kinase family protein, partial [Gemmataceae bacterium]|nr:cytidylate kinase family protein [Gemmataceae bacterium]